LKRRLEEKIWGEESWPERRGFGRGVLPG